MLIRGSFRCHRKERRQARKIGVPKEKCDRVAGGAAATVLTALATVSERQCAGRSLDSGSARARCKVLTNIARVTRSLFSTVKRGVCGCLRCRRPVIYRRSTDKTDGREIPREIASELNRGGGAVSVRSRTRRSDWRARGADGEAGEEWQKRERERKGTIGERTRGKASKRDVGREGGKEGTGTERALPRDRIARERKRERKEERERETETEREHVKECRCSSEEKCERSREQRAGEVEGILPGMAARTGDGGGETPATVLDDNAGGIVTTAGPLAESSTSSSSSSSASAAAAVVPTVILTESTATSAGRLPLTGSQQQSNLHQVHQQQQQQQQQQSRQRVNLIADVVVNDVAGNLNDSRS
ncbi:hypothetical protein DBV15_10065 [Temnothorax longispinosus]|uniref:Uncharacterized protein n=1 Tax=Temnothorax longispinosus TaxID=300112 RepID=A0A4S2L252_9HYME|nr:hypothetical protein DBV15_10065 [Temnothorax longispinosus]